MRLAFALLILATALACSSIFCAIADFGGAAAAEDGAGGGQCWPEAALKARPGEKISRRAPYDPAIEPKFASLNRSPVPDQWRGSIRRVELPQGVKLIALTFDLCETAGEISGYDGAIVDTLRANRVKATFFAGGKWLLDHKERAEQLLADPLFEVGGHSWSHENFRLMTPEAVKHDLTLELEADEATRQELEAKTCFKNETPPKALGEISVFRFPFGTCNPESMKAVNDAGLAAIQWDVVSADPVPAQSAALIRRAVLAAAKPGSIVVMHGNGRGRHTAEALPLVIADLRKRGFEFATVSELLVKGKPVIADSCYELKPGDNLRYDKLFPLRKSSPVAPRFRSTGWKTVTVPQ